MAESRNEAFGKDWGSESVGTESNSAEAENAASFTPLEVSRKKGQDIPDDVEARMVRNHLNTGYSADASQVRGGNRFYDDAHRLAVQNVIGNEPGVQSSPAARGEGTSRRMQRPSRSPSGQSRMDRARRVADIKGDDLVTPLADKVEAAHPGAIHRETGSIAALSPSGGGMTWENNAQASYELRNVDDKTMEGIRGANSLQHLAGRARGALKRKVLPEPRDVLSHRADALGEKASAASSAARVPLEGTQLKYTSGSTVERAYDIHHGNVPVEDSLPMDLKTGHFQQNIEHPRACDTGATIDGRCHDIGYGRELIWDTNRGLTSKGRYNAHQSAQRTAAQVAGRLPHQQQAVEWIADKDHSMAGQSDKQKAIGQGFRRKNAGKPIGQENTPAAW